MITKGSDKFFLRLCPNDLRAVPSTDHLVPVNDVASLFEASNADFTSKNLFRIGILLIPSSIFPVIPRFFSISTKVVANDLVFSINSLDDEIASS
jgi:hypothetical protein